MFRSILPSRRVPSADFQMLTGSPFAEPNGKENCYPHLTTATNERPRSEKHKKSKGKDTPVDGVVTTEAFNRLLDDLQIPSTLRPKLDGMNSTVKAAMLKSSQVLAPSKPSTATLSMRGIRRSRSSESLQSQTRHTLEQSDLFDSSKGLPSFVTTGYIRGTSFNFSRSQVDLHEPNSAAFLPKSVKEKRTKVAGKPEKWCKILATSSSIRLEVETVKKLRLLLRNEAASWTEEFLAHGGYDALLARLKEILEVEWREEQHDDQMLHELLRCFKGLSTSAVGCAALRSRYPAPYNDLVTLLYSDKKPGDIGTRQLVIELLLILFELYPPSALPSAGSPVFATQFPTHARTQSVPWEQLLHSPAQSNLVTLPAPYDTLFALVRSLLLTPAPPKAEQTGVPVEPHEFIEELHRPRIYKTYIQELSDLCRDYFWVFCHPNNTVWNLEETDESKVERPRAPGGMTGGVEFEAMSYMTTHFRFLNAVCKAVQDLNLPKDHEHSAYKFHSDMFLSGLERVLLVARKASVTYYPTLHLEIARYVAAIGRAGFELPWSLSRLIGSPPSSMRKVAPESAPVSNLGKGSLPVPGSAPASPTKKQRPGTTTGTCASGLPAVRNVTPMFH
ncbi:hypothetical protein OBBRIDRAFT_750238 [Obba rivulosa]|uniref:Formin GTPase-binding domain-containing protein n=1 Tax=Obba rivulosa TaxID=1052685 RepID=A0A8E2DP48_9APHY|nr:hypothetical protein OBBRIDRAFT_750238 [Obba rivulosa]